MLLESDLAAIKNFNTTDWKGSLTVFCVNPYNPQDTAEVFWSYYGDIYKLNAMSKAGLELVQKNHLIKHFVDAFESSLEEVASS